MKRLHILYTLLFIWLLPVTSNGQPAGKEKLRVISYNIWNGFEHDASRRANFINWIKGQQPDILAMTELVGFTEKDLGQLASEYGHKYYAIVKEEGYPVGITSNEPITVVKKQMEGFWHGMLHVKTHGLDMIVTHLSPHDWKFRLKEAQMLTSYIHHQRCDRRSKESADRLYHRRELRRDYPRREYQSSRRLQAETLGRENLFYRLTYLRIM